MERSAIRVDGKVIPWHRPMNRRGGGRMKPPADVQAQTIIAHTYRRAGGKHYGDAAVIVEIDVFRQCPKRGKYPEHDCHTPDIDNIAKQVLDGLEGVAYTNDKQVVALHVMKHPRDRVDEHMLITVAPADPVANNKEI